MGSHTKIGELQDEFIEIQLSATNALGYILRYKDEGQRFLLEFAEKKLRECASNHFLQELVRADVLYEHLYVRDLRTSRKQHDP
jgi:hypothetical protein